MANIFASAGYRHIEIDLMRYFPAEASGFMEFMFLSIIDHFKTLGTEEFSLGSTPLSGLSDHACARSLNRFGSMVYRHGGALYDFEGLHAFKQEFQPDWRSRYLILPPVASPLRAMGDIALLIAGSTCGLIAK